MNTDPLISTLIDLSRAIDRSDFKLILAGGFGLYLKQIHLQRQAMSPTFMSGNLWPRPRATEDLDIVLPTEVLVSTEGMQALRQAIDHLGFKPVKGAEFLHFEKAWSPAGRVKIDLLTGPVPEAVSRKNLKFTPPRIRPRGHVELHAYLTKEALDFESSLLPLTIEGVGSNAILGHVVVYVPQPFTFLLMKLHAFADRLQDKRVDLGRHHALDVYRIIAMLTEEEYEGVRQNIEKHAASPPIHRAREIVLQHFSSPAAMGVIRVQEHPLFAAPMNTTALVNALDDLFR